MIPYGRQYIDIKDREAVDAVLLSERLTQGPLVEQFEQRVAAYCGATYAVAVNSGTSALHIAYLAAGIGPGDEVITTPNTFIATSNMLVAIGAVPVLCDIELTTYNIDISKIEALITDKTKAIVPVHFSGHPVRMDDLYTLAKKYNLLLIDDACQALGASYGRDKIGSGKKSDLTVLSFHPVKSITTGEGGAVLTNNKNMYEKMLRLRSHGITRDPALMEEHHGDWYFEMYEMGFNYRLTDIQAALGISQLEKLDEFVEERKKQVNYYLDALKNISGLILPQQEDTISSAHHLFVIRVDREKRKQVFDMMRQADIWVQVHHVPVHIHPFYKKYFPITPMLPNADAYYASCMSLPLYPGLTKSEQDFVIATLKNSVSCIL